jgi:ABC-2 type transport system permease protein
MKLNWAHDLGGLAVIMIASVLAAAALGTMLGTLVKTESQASGLSIMLGMVMALLGGCWYPSELFPPVVQNIVKVFPTTWAMQGMLDLVLRGRDLAAVLPEAGVLLGFAGVFFLIGVLRFRYE